MTIECMLQFICERQSGVCDFDLNLFVICVRIYWLSRFRAVSITVICSVHEKVSFE